MSNAAIERRLRRGAISPEDLTDPELDGIIRAANRAQADKSEDRRDYQLFDSLRVERTKRR